MELDLICAGEMLIDFTPASTPFTYTANPGGAPANVAIAASRNGLKVGFLGKLGKDDFGKRLKAVLLEDQVETLIPNLCEEAITTLAFVTLYEGGERSFTFARKPGADLLLSKEDIKEEDISRCKLFHAGSFSLSSDPSRTAIAYGMKTASKLGKLVSFDVNYRNAIWPDEESCKKEVDALLPYIDLLKISDEELYFVGGQDNIPAFMKQHNIRVVIETLGAKGAKYYFDGQSEVVEGKKVTAIDATGAGDAFWGSFLSYLLMQNITKPDDIQKERIKQALQYGNTAGGICVQSFGGIPSLPTKEKIEASL